ncbi:MAG: hypothetical protein QOD01_2406 [Actinomycetota bacterium]|jgi:hypothetical protein|nr:hypothetical protein [Actinomycetota bacterium]
MPGGTASATTSAVACKDEDLTAVCDGAQACGPNDGWPEVVARVPELGLASVDGHAHRLARLVRGEAELGVVGVEGGTKWSEGRANATTAVALALFLGAYPSMAATASSRIS